MKKKSMDAMLTQEKKKKRFFSSEEEFYEEDEVDNEDDDDESDIEDEEDEDDDDESDMDDENDDDEIDDEEYKKMRRRKRRIRNQILSYLIVIVLLAALVGGIVFAGSKALKKISKPKAESQETVEETEENDNAEGFEILEEEIVIAEPTPEEEELLSPLDEIATAKIAEMPLEDKVAGLFMVTPEELTGVTGVTKAGETTKNALTEYKVGGILYTADNITGGDQLKELLENTALIDQTLFLAVNEEGGNNSVVASKISSVEKGADAKALSETADVTKAKEAGQKIGTYLSEYGFNLNLAPVADVDLGGSILENRTFGTDAELVGNMSAAFIEGMSPYVSSCVKTFPGLGSMTESPEAGMANNERTLSDMESVEFAAYKKALDAGAEFLMVGTISASDMVGDNTACCLSKSAISVVRESLGFDGVVLTGYLNETAITDYHTPDEAAVLALKAGADMLVRPQDFKTAYQGVLDAVADGTLEESRIDESLLRIYRIKYKDKVEEL